MGSECSRNKVTSSIFEPQKLQTASSSTQGLSGSPMKHKKTNKNPDVRKCDASMIIFIKLHFPKTNPAALEYGLHHCEAQVLHFVPSSRVSQNITNNDKRSRYCCCCCSAGKNFPDPNLIQHRWAAPEAQSQNQDLQDTVGAPPSTFPSSSEPL